MESQVSSTVTDRWPLREGAQSMELEIHKTPIPLQFQKGSSWEMSFTTSDVELLLRKRQLANLPQFYQEVFPKLNEQGM